MQKVSYPTLGKLMAENSKLPSEERRKAEKRQKAKASNKKAQAEASRKNAESTARLQAQRVQVLRSEMFAAARSGDFPKVKRGIWEDDVDAAGGEIKKGSEEFVSKVPTDPSETLMHIAASKGDADFVQWLDDHSQPSSMPLMLTTNMLPLQVLIQKNAILWA